jgi:hypothetical protein
MINPPSNPIYVAVALPKCYTMVLNSDYVVKHQPPTGRAEETSDRFDQLNVPSLDEIAESPFLDTGDIRMRKKAVTRSFHLSNASGVSKWNDEVNFDDQSPRSISRSREDLSALTLNIEHDESHCIVCQKNAELGYNFKTVPAYHSIFSKSFDGSLLAADKSKDLFVAKEIIRLFNNMCNSVGIKTAERELLL